jgi:predicted Zn-dependent protease
VGAAEAAPVGDVLARYDAARRLPDVADEAAIREAWLLHRTGSDAEALMRLDAVSDQVADPTLRFLRQLFRGRVLMALNRPAEAATAYRAALVSVPGAPSALNGLATALTESGNQDEARALAQAPPTVSDPEADPWSMYEQGDYWRFPGALSRLRAAVR